MGLFFHADQLCLFLHQPFYENEATDVAAGFVGEGFHDPGAVLHGVDDGRLGVRSDVRPVARRERQRKIQQKMGAPFPAVPRALFFRFMVHVRRNFVDFGIFEFVRVPVLRLVAVAAKHTSRRRAQLFSLSGLSAQH